MYSYLNLLQKKKQKKSYPNEGSEATKRKLRFVACFALESFHHMLFTHMKFQLVQHRKLESANFALISVLIVIQHMIAETSFGR